MAVALLLVRAFLSDLRLIIPTKTTRIMIFYACIYHHANFLTHSQPPPSPAQSGCTILVEASMSLAVL